MTPREAAIAEVTVRREARAYLDYLRDKGTPHEAASLERWRAAGDLAERATQHALKLVMFVLMVFVVACTDNADITTVESPEGVPTIDVAFSPGPGCRDLVIRHIDSAEYTINVEAYAFTSRPIADALIRAIGRGRKVTMVVDSRYRDEPIVRELDAGGAEVRYDDHHGIAHSKVIIVDGARVQIGSFNYSASGVRNRENCIIIRDPAVAYIYEVEWTHHYYHSRLLPPVRSTR